MLRFRVPKLCEFGVTVIGQAKPHELRHGRIRIGERPTQGLRLLVKSVGLDFVASSRGLSDQEFTQCRIRYSLRPRSANPKPDLPVNSGALSRHTSSAEVGQPDSREPPIP
jgi:hypothetical protein